VARFEEGVEQVRLLLEETSATHKGQFHSFENVRSLPRPTQTPRPRFYVAAVATPDSFERAGRNGHYIMGIPGVGSEPAELVNIYRDAWHSEGHKGDPKIMMAVTMFCHEDREAAVRIAKPRIERHLASIHDAMSGYADGKVSENYKGYAKMREKIGAETFESQVQQNAAFVGTPADLIEQFHEFDKQCGGCDHFSLQININDTPYDDAEKSVRLFGETVIPHFAAA